MQVVDYNSFSVGSRYSGDLDLALYNSQGELIGTSNETSEFEEVEVPVDGNYFISAFAYSGTSKYAIKIIDQANAMTSLKKQSMDFIPGQAIIKTQKQKVEISKTSAGNSNFAKLSHTQKNRATLASWSIEEHNYSKTSVVSNLNKAFEESNKKLATLNEIKKLQQQKDIDLAEPNYIRQPLLVPNDQFYNLQWHYPAMNLPQAWDITTGTAINGEDVVVAVLDTGVYLDHPEFEGQLVQGYDFISSSSNALDGNGIDNNPDDPGDSQFFGASSWHGTHVAGTIAAKTNNDIGVAGVSWGAKIMPVRVLGAQGGSTYDILQGLRYAAGLSNDSGTLPTKAADIINLSLGGEGGSAAEQALYQEIYNLGIITVSASGNSNTSRLFYPASYDGVISVAALDAENNRAPYSNYGTAIDIAAPGGDKAVDRDGDGRPDGILSTLVDDSSGSRQATLDFQQGTSMAAPHVAGMFALMKALYPELSASQAQTALQSGALTQDAGSTGRDDIYGYGIADALKAVQEAQRLASGGAPPEIPASLVASPSAVNIGFSETATLTISNRGGGHPSVTAVSSDETWLSVTSASVDAQGLGSYQLNIDRNGLVDGIYVANIDFTFDGAPALKIRVSMRSGMVETDGSLAKIYVLLFDPEAENGEGAVVEQAIATNVENGLATFSFPDAPAGSYYIFAGTDIDNDGIICQFGEGCGSYPSMNEATLITIDESSTQNIDFVVDILAGFTNIQSLSLGTENKSPIPIKKLERLPQ